jgi:hypothetical protein
MSPELLKMHERVDGDLGLQGKLRPLPEFFIELIFLPASRRKLLTTCQLSKSLG